MQVEANRDYIFEYTDETGVIRYELGRVEGGYYVQHRWRDESVDGHRARMRGGRPVMIELQEFVDAHVAQGHTQLAARKARMVPARPATLARGQLAPLAGVDEKRAKAAISKAVKAKLSAKIPEIFEAASSYDDAPVLFWHLVRNDHLDISANRLLLEAAADYLDDASPSDIIDLLVKLPPFSKLCEAAGVSPESFLPDYSTDLDRLLWSAVRRDSALVRARAHELSPALQVAVRCVRRRLGETLTPEEAESVKDAFKKAKLRAGDAVNVRVVQSVAPPDARPMQSSWHDDELVTVSAKGLLELFTP